MSKVRVNLANPAELCEISGITSTEAEAIVRFRADHGPIRRPPVNESTAPFVYVPGTDMRFEPARPRPTKPRTHRPTLLRVMGTRFRPADPDAVRQRFAVIQARAFQRVAEEQRLILERLASEREAEKELSDGIAVETSARRDDRRDARLRHGPDPPDADHD